MVQKVYVESVSKPGLKFEVLSFDQATQRGVLRGEMGEDFERDLSKEALVKHGYKIEVVDVEEPEPQPE